jgi:hypothetical protein
MNSPTDKKPPRAVIVIYDEDTQQMKLLSVARRSIAATIDKELARSGGMNIPLGAEDGGEEGLTDEDARRVGCLAMLMHAAVHPEIRNRLKITTAEPVDWGPIERPE